MLRGFIKFLTLLCKSSNSHESNEYLDPNTIVDGYYQNDYNNNPNHDHDDQQDNNSYDQWLEYTDNNGINLDDFD